MPAAKYGPENTITQIGLLELADQQSLGQGVKTATATSGAATLNQPSGVVTSEALSTAATAVYTLTLTNNQILATDIIQATCANGTNTGGAPVVSTANAANGSIVFKVVNAGASALNGTITVQYVIWKL